MAPPKKTKGVTTEHNLSYDEMIKALKAIKGSQSIIGTEEIFEQCSLNKIPTGIPTIDYITGGGITEGRITILAGNPSSCKTTLTLQILAVLTKRIKARVEAGNSPTFVLYFDVEGGYDPVYATALGVIQDYIIVKRTKVIEDAFSEADQLVSLGWISALVIDSLDGMISKKVDDNAYENTMGGTSGALAAHLPNLYSKLLNHCVTTLIIKQARVKLDAYGAKGEIITFSGGKALRHFSDSIFIVKRLSNRDLDYCPIQIKAEKTRSPRMGLTLDMPLGICGIDPLRDLVQVAKLHDLIIVGGGGWMSYAHIREQGEKRFIEHLKQNPEDLELLRSDVYDTIINSLNVTGGVSEAGEIQTVFEDDKE